MQFDCDHVYFTNETGCSFGFNGFTVYLLTPCWYENSKLPNEMDRSHDSANELRKDLRDLRSAGHNKKQNDKDKFCIIVAVNGVD